MESFMIDPAWAHDFAKEWIAAWNSHDLDRILSHYVEDFEMSSPLIVERKIDPGGVLRGKAAIRESGQSAWRLFRRFNLS
jgi:ketosteroid isomerase-like protein